jgi:hypothetical protein
MKEKRGEMSPKSRRVLGKPPRCCMQLVPSNMTLPCKNSKQKLAGNAARTPIFVTEISVYTQKISSKVLYIKIIFLTYL